MAGTLQICDAVVTEQVLRRQHAGQTEVVVSPRAVVTPTGWDYLRSQRLRLVRGSVPAASHHPQAPPAAPAKPAPAAGGAAPAMPGTIAEVVPPGRYDHPDRAYGCRTEEFGSGFVEPASCGGCAVRAGAGAGGCGGCNKAAGPADTDLEVLVQRLTDEIMSRLGGA